MENPFCTRNIRPGVKPFLFSPGQTAEELVERLKSFGWRGEIVGPHGSGKSALLEELTPWIERAGRQPFLVELHDGQRRLEIDLKKDARLQSKMLLMVDGYEQLSGWSRFWLKLNCRRHGWGLLVTAHDSVGFPHVYQTGGTLDLAHRIVGQLLAGKETSFTNEEVADCWERHRGDMREMLFELYDLYERKARDAVE